MAQLDFIHYGLGQVFESRGSLSVCGLEVDFSFREGHGELKALRAPRRIDDDFRDGFSGWMPWWSRGFIRP